MDEGKRSSRLYGTVKVGDKEQVVVPAEVLNKLDIKPGNLLLAIASRNRRGIAVVKAEPMSKLAEKIIRGLEVTEEQRP
jgi:AbrB family looped-hinge helix DNA binding protein